MLSDQELENLLRDLESDRVERKPSFSDRDKIKQTVCAFANDLPDHRLPGVVFIGAKDKDGSCAGLEITDELLTQISSIRDQIQPIPSIDVQRRVIAGCTVAVIAVYPSEAPPVRFSGRSYIRVGPSTRLAEPADERRLTERRRRSVRPFDVQPVHGASQDDLDVERFSDEYLPNAFAPDVLVRNQRSTEDQLAALGFMTSDGMPTNAGLLVLGVDPRRHLPGAYVQFGRYDGEELTDPIKDQKEIDGPFPDLLRRLTDVLSINISTSLTIRPGFLDAKRPDYPLNALLQLAYNAVMHRSFEGTNAPVRVYWFSDRVEIISPGGPFGNVTKESFGQPNVTDYRNPTLAEAMKVMGYVQRFGMGIPLARKELRDNGNPIPEFIVEGSWIAAIVRAAT